MDYFVMEEPFRLLGVGIASIAFVAACLFWFRNKDNNHDNIVTTTASSTTSVDKGKSDEPIANTPILRNVFSVKQKPTVVAETSTTGGRPFESSYYFAHNRHSTGGGYKDGLRAEDYVMNGPRLLSKGGIPVIGDSNNSMVDTHNGGDDGIPPQSDETMNNNTTNTDGPKRKMVASTPITKYMWDDDGTGNVAKIHIDSLPISLTKAIQWADAGISSIEQIQVRLIGDNNDGLYIGITSHDGKRRHHLHVPKMYGEAESVKAIPKRHKLLVKVTKKRTSRKRHSKHGRHSKFEDEGIWTRMTKSIGNLIGGGGASGNDEEEYTSQSWPRLSASSAGGLGGSSCEIDEKLFKELGMVGKGVDDF